VQVEMRRPANCWKTSKEQEHVFVHLAFVYVYKLFTVRTHSLCACERAVLDMACMPASGTAQARCTRACQPCLRVHACIWHHTCLVYMCMPAMCMRACRQRCTPHLQCMCMPAMCTGHDVLHFAVHHALGQC
jgi:hypothetical protein